jgi:large subunit ribosomal protein L24
MKVKSKQPKKQRKFLYNNVNHQRSKLLSTRLADFLQEEYGIKQLPLRVGDSVRVTKGEFMDFEGEVIDIDRKNQRIQMKECVVEKADGTQYHPTLHTSKLIITKFHQEGRKMDAFRAKMIERKASFGAWGAEEEIKAPKKGKEVD